MKIQEIADATNASIITPTYTPRRASLKRWLDSAPTHILDCFDDGENCKHADRFTVFFTGPGYLMTRDNKPRTFGNTIVPYLGASERPSHPQGFGQHGELSADQTAAYRYRNGKRRVRWLDLPEAVRNACT